MTNMRRLLLFRHAKSSWADPELEDFDRPLNGRGRLAAPLMGAWIADRGLTPDLVLASSSARTRETWERAAVAFAPPPEMETSDRLYHACPDAMLALAQAAPDAAAGLMILGHQPGIGAFCRKLSAPEPPAHCARAFQKFPTAAVAVLEFDVARWRDVAYGAGRFTQFAVPRELV